MEGRLRDERSVEYQRTDWKSIMYYFQIANEENGNEILGTLKPI